MLQCLIVITMLLAVFLCTTGAFAAVMAGLTTVGVYFAITALIAFILLCVNC